MQEGTGAGVTAHTAPMAVAQVLAAVMGRPGYIDNVGNQKLLQVVLEVLAGLL